jgi:hypothetical protein
VVDLVHHEVADEALERAEVHDVAGARVDAAAHRHLEGVVVPVPVRIVALAEEAHVLLVGQRGVVHAVRGVEAQQPRDGDGRHGSRGVGAGRTARGGLTRVIPRQWGGGRVF